jgi:hypothetical protein
MKKNLAPVILLIIVIISTPIFTTAQEPSAVIGGRWDITMKLNNQELPSWLEVMHSGIRTWVGRFVGTGGSARPVAEIFVDSNHFHFSIPPQWEPENNYLKMEGTFSGNAMEGNITLSNGTVCSFTGKRAPSLKRDKKPVWNKPIKLFNGKDMAGWKAMGTNQWVVENGVLKSPKSGANIRTEQVFTDFKLHVEFRYPPHSNSGVYLRGRYEVQIEDDKGKEPFPGGFGAIYGFITPYEMMAKSPGEWQSYDITLVGRMVTVVANGKLIINNQEIPGITGGALDSNEGEPGPIYFQGDHGPIEFRNIIITTAK